MLRKRHATAVAFLLAFSLADAAVAADSPTPSDDKPPFRVVYRGTLTLPETAPDADGEKVEISGLSGVTWLGDDRYAAIMDNSDKLMLFRLSLAWNGAAEEIRDASIFTLAESHDYEDLAPCPAALEKRIAQRWMRQGSPDPGRCMLVCEENTPAIRAISLADGGLLGVVPIPERFSTRRPNRGLEALAVDPDGGHIWTANEEALPTDGPVAALDAGTVVRLVRVGVADPDQKTMTQTLQYAYPVDAPHRFLRVFAGEPLSGVAALVALGEGQLLVLERSGGPGLPPFTSRIYLVDTAEAQDVSGIDRDLAARPDRYVKKVLLWQDQLGCNVEGLCLGPELGGGRRSLIGISDNGGIGLPNQLVCFALESTDNVIGLSIVVGVAGVSVAVALTVVGFARRRMRRQHRVVTSGERHEVSTTGA